MILDVRGLQKYYPVRKSFLSSSSDVVHAVEDISFQIRAGETFSLVGETGSGKSTVASMIMRLIEPTAGEIEFDGKNMLTQNRKELRETRRDIQMIFQDPYASLNPRMTVESTVGLPLEQLKISSGKEKRQRVIQLLETVGLKPAEKILDRFPHEFSGGQKQRIGVARALALSPKFIVADEPVSSLDISIRAQILNLLKDLKERYNLTYLLIAHDLSVVKYMSDWVCIMYLGRGMELARVKEFYKKPLHPYTKSLLSAVPPIHPSIEKKRIKLKGEMPSAINPPSGCLFHTRCPYTEEKCININPNFMEIRPGHWVSCHRWDEL